MNVYKIDANVDNPLFDGLGLDPSLHHLLEFWPTGWNKNYRNWQPLSRKDNWPTPVATGNLRLFNDYPGIDLSTPAFSQRAVDLLYDLLEPNGELLPVKHKVGTYYVYNCTRVVDCIDLERSEYLKLPKGLVGTFDRYEFVAERVQNLTLFKILYNPIMLFCTQRFVDRVESCALQGFVFVKVWPLPNGVDYLREFRKAHRKAEKIRPNEGPKLDVKGNTVVIRLYTAKKKPTKVELTSAERIMSNLEEKLYDPGQSGADYCGNVEGHDVVDHEIRIVLSSPDSNRLIEQLRPYLRSLPWRGKYHVVQRFGEFTDAEAPIKYVAL